MNLSAIFSKTGKGVQEASGKTSHLSRADRAVLSAIDGKTALSEVLKNFDKLAGPKFEALIQQLDKDGFIREVSSGAASAPAPRQAAPAAKAPPKAAPPPPADDGSDGLDFTQAIKVTPKAPSAPKPPPVDLAAAARADAERRAKEQQGLDYKARQEAEAKAKAEAEAKARAAAAEAKARAEAEAKARAEAEARAHADADAKVKAAREAAVRMATEAKARAEAEARAKTEAAEKDKARLEAELNAKLEAERKAREEAERRAAEAAERARKELEEKAKRDAEELRQRLEAEMKAKLEAERKAREEEERKRREEEDRRRKEEDERRAKEEAERRAREEAERKKREEEDRKRREDDDRRRKEEDARRAKEDAERRAREEADAKARAAADAAASLPKIETVAPPPPPPPPPKASAGDFGDSLLADLDNFGKREEEEQKAREEAERKAKAEAERKAKEEAERKAREEADKKRREEDERRRKEEDERRAREEEERKEREEEERRKEEEAERKRKAKEAAAAKQAEERAAKAAAAKGASRKVTAGDDDIPVTDEDLDTDDLKRDQKVAAERARKAAREAPPVAVATGGRPKKWGKPVAIALFGLLIVGVGVLNFLPVSTAEYEKAASDAMGVPVKIGSARLSVLTGIEVKLEGVSIGSAKIRSVRGSPEVGSLFGARKAFSRVDLDGVQIAQSQIGDALLGKVSGENFRIGRVTAKQLVLDGPLKLPPLDLDATVAGDGTFQSVKLSGADKLSVTLQPKGSDIAFEISAASFTPPFVPALNLSEFSMKGTANRSGVVGAEFDGRAYDGVLNGTVRMRWGDNWSVEGEVKPRNLKVAVFAPTLVSEGRVEGRAAYSMAGSSPGSLLEGARMQGEFKVEKGVLGSFDVARALQTGGMQSGGRTVFNEMTGQGVYDKGAMQFTNVIISAGALNAGASLNIDASGTLSGRIVADVKTASQKQSATLNITGKVQDPVLRK